MTIVYVVGKIGFDYNDEIYSSSNYDEDGAVNPIAVYRNKNNAELVALEKNFEKLSSEDLGYYGYGLEDIVPDVDTLEATICKLTKNDQYHIKENDSNWKMPKMPYALTVAEKQELISCFTLRFYEVKAVDLID